VTGVPSLRLTIMSGAGNRFAVADAFRDGALTDASGLARRVCADPELSARFRPDGLLIATPPRTPSGAVGPAARMILYNADGSRPEACGNGLRCIAKFVRDQGHVTTDVFAVETDAGARHVELERAEPGRVPGRVIGARVAMGPVRVVESAACFTGLPSSVGTTTAEATLVSVGNPHAVLVVDDERTAPVAMWGAAIERDERFARGTNVGFLALRDGVLRLRVWERGVGETLACGSGACAAAVVAVRAGRVSWPVALELPGGRLVVDGDPETNVTLTGPAEELGKIAVARTDQAASLGLAP